MAFAGLVIGRDGATMRNISRQFSVDMDVYNEEVCGETVKMIALSGSDANVKNAKKKIESLILGAKENRKRRQDSDDNSTNKRNK